MIVLVAVVRRVPVIEVEVKRIVEGHREVLVRKSSSTSTTERTSPSTPVAVTGASEPSSGSRRIQHRAWPPSSWHDTSSTVRSPPPDDRDAVPPAPRPASVSLLPRRDAKAEDPASVLGEAVARVRASSEPELIKPRDLGGEVVGRGEGLLVKDGRLGQDLLETSSEGGLSERE